MIRSEQYIDPPDTGDRTLRVLVLEDNPDDAELMCHELEEAGFDLHQTVVSNLDAFRSALSENIDLILADYTLPQSTALDALTVLKDSNFQIPLIVVTGSVSEEVAVACMKEGAADYVLKDRRKRLAPAVNRAIQDQIARKRRIHAENALARSERAYRQFFDTTPVPTWVHEPDTHRIRAVNDAATRVFGYDRQEFLHSTALDLIAEDHHEKLIAYLSDRASFPRGELLTGIRKDGAELSIRFKANDLDSSVDSAVIATAKDVTEIVRTRQQNQKLIQGLKDVSLRLQETQEKERKRIADDLHDDVGAALTALMIEVELLGDGKPERSAIEDVKLSIKQVMRRIRQVIFDLRPSTLGKYELKGVLKNYFEQLAASSELKMDYTADVPDGKRFPDEIETAVFRITQEATTNVLRHSGVRQASSTLCYEDSQLVVEISDNGCGFNSNPDNLGSETYGRGVTGMRERAQVLGGELSVDSKDGVGTTIRATFPVS